MFSKFGTIFRRDASISPKDPPEKQKISHLKEKCTCVLFRARTKFPFDLFPDDIIIDSEKVNIIIREFFATEQIHCIPIKNITDLSVEHGFYFATFKILPARVFQNQVLSVKNLNKKDAIEALSIIQGLMIADRENINLDSIIHTEDGVKEIEAMGKAI